MDFRVLSGPGAHMQKAFVSYSFACRTPTRGIVSGLGHCGSSLGSAQSPEVERYRPKASQESCHSSEPALV